MTFKGFDITVRPMDYILGAAIIGLAAAGWQVSLRLSGDYNQLNAEISEYRTFVQTQMHDEANRRIQTFQVITGNIESLRADIRALIECAKREG